jgi:phosphate transport system substrate-binding protein
MVNLALAWAEAYEGTHSDVSLSVTGGGSGTGIAALINNTVDIANASRAIKAEEQDEAIANGLAPVEFVVARDAIAIIVHPDNPVNQLSLPQLSASMAARSQLARWGKTGPSFCCRARRIRHPRLFSRKCLAAKKITKPCFL